jgi:hypothetical protein
VRRHHQLDEIAVAVGEQCLDVAFDCGLERLFVLVLGVLLDEVLDSCDVEV